MKDTLSISYLKKKGNQEEGKGKGSHGNETGGPQPQGAVISHLNSVLGWWHRLSSSDKQRLSRCGCGADHQTTQFCLEQTLSSCGCNIEDLGHILSVNAEADVLGDVARKGFRASREIIRATTRLRAPWQVSLPWLWHHLNYNFGGRLTSELTQALSDKCLSLKGNFNVN